MENDTAGMTDRMKDFMIRKLFAGPNSLRFIWLIRVMKGLERSTNY